MGCCEDKENGKDNVDFSESPVRKKSWWVWAITIIVLSLFVIGYLM